MRITPMALAGLIALGACNESQTGAEGTLAFTPSQCGFRLGGCSFEAPTAVGGTIEVGVESVDDTPTAGIALVAADSDQLRVEAMTDEANRIWWDVTPLVTGDLELVAKDAAGRKVDSVVISVVAPARLGLAKVVGQATGPVVDGSSETWTVPADKAVSFEVAVRDDQNRRLMGRFTYAVETPADAPAPMQLSGSNPAVGFLYMRPAANDYPMVLRIVEGPAVSGNVVIRAAP